MYEFIDGVPCAYDASGHLILDNEAAGVGYSIVALSRDWDYWSQLNDNTIRVFIRPRFSESLGYTLFGFSDVRDRTAFDFLTTVKGVAGKGAMAILAVHTPEQLATHIEANDAKAIATAKGVGPKLARQIIVELSGKMGASGDASQLSEAASAGVDAIASLGYDREKALNVALKLPEDTVDYIRAIIQKLS